MTEYIKNIDARQVLDSRGNPTIYTCVETDKNKGVSIVPSGASTGSREALELRDSTDLFNGKSVNKAVNNIKEILSPLLNGLDICNQEEIDNLMIHKDGTESKSTIGANAILGVSMAAARAGAKSKGLELFEYIRQMHSPSDNSFLLPNPMFNVLNGGSHAFNSTDFQEFMVVPLGVDNYEESLLCGFQIYNELKKILEKEKLPTTLGDEGGFAPPGLTNTEPLELLTEATKKTSFELGKQVKFALDVAASEFYSEDKYKLRSENRSITSDELIEIYEELSIKYPIYSIEDGLSEDDWDGWEKMTNKIGDKLQLVGDDLYVTQKKYLEKGIKEKSGNSILIKLNQVGTVSETIETIKIAQDNKFETIISHRSGETEDTFIADLAVGTNSAQIKSGAPARGERINKYNRLLIIGDILKNKGLNNNSHKTNSIG
ncbi:MAG: phosphopyruvate hydratase [Chloroflexota bacterium]|nr:phosphopyruvate hydratase [Chloroflexota bacterium]